MISLSIACFGRTQMSPSSWHPAPPAPALPALLTPHRPMRLTPDIKTSCSHNEGETQSSPIPWRSAPPAPAVTIVPSQPGQPHSHLQTFPCSLVQRACPHADSSACHPLTKSCLACFTKTAFIYSYHEVAPGPAAEHQSLPSCMHLPSSEDICSWIHTGEKPAWCGTPGLTLTLPTRGTATLLRSSGFALSRPGRWAELGHV